MILTSTLLIVLIVAGFGVLNLFNVRDLYDQTAREKIESFQDALKRKGETTTLVFAKAMLGYLIDNEDENIRALVADVANQDEDIRQVYVLQRNREVVASCRVRAGGEQICEDERYGEPIADEAWARVEQEWAARQEARETGARQEAGNANALIAVDVDGGDGRVKLFAYPVMSGNEQATPRIALAPEAGPSRRGYVAIGYDLNQIDKFARDSQRQRRQAQKRSIVRVAAIGALFVLIGTLLAIFQGLSISKPIKMLAWKADQIAHGDLEARVAVASGDEIGVLGENFNFMADQLVVLLEQTREKATLEKELEVARTIQETLVPPGDPIVRGPFELAGYFQPASHCGGDWWTYHELVDDKLLVVIGDVTGHGVPSAMITATAKAACDVARAVHGDDVTVTRLLEIMNHAIFQSAKRKFVMTCTAAVIDPVQRTITYANAGHNFPYLYRTGEAGAGEFGSLMIRGNRLGDLRDSRYEAKTIELRSGDLLVWYTDGIVECENADGDEYGEKRFRASIREAAHLSVGELRDQVVADALAFYGEVPRKDDITMVIGRMA